MALEVEPLANRKALAFWKDKVLLSSGQFSKLSDAAKMRAFGVTGIAKGAELESVFKMLQAAIEKGISFDEFKSSLSQVWQRRGWTGKGAWRIDNIFRTNIQTAYNVGRYHQMQQVTQARPFWQYDAVNDRRTRPTHRAMDAKIFRHDHPFWDTWYPPNGFRCRCGVNTLSQREIERDGLTVEEKDPTGTLIEPATADGTPMPARLLMPDPGFDHNPGKTVWGGITDESSKHVWNDMVDLKSAAAMGRPKIAAASGRAYATGMDGMLETGRDKDYYREAFSRLFGPEKLLTDASGNPVVMTLDRFMASDYRHVAPLIEDVLSDPWELWLVPQVDERGRVRLVRRFFERISDGGQTSILVMEADKGSWLGVSGLMPVSQADELEALRHGLLLWRSK